MAQGGHWLTSCRATDSDRRRRRLLGVGAQRKAGQDRVEGGLDQFGVGLLPS